MNRSAFSCPLPHLALGFLLLAGCEPSPVECEDAPCADAATRDGSIGSSDAGPESDAGFEARDAAPEMPDAGPVGMPVDGFGATGDGVTDDTDAIQAAFDSGEHVYFTAGRTYLFDSTLRIDADGDQIIDGQGATLMAGTEMSRGVVVEKATGVTTIRDLTLDANRSAEWAWKLESSFDLYGVEVRNVWSDDQSAIGFFATIRATGNWTVSNMTDCVCDDVVAEGNGSLTDAIGAARCLLYDYASTPADLDAVFTNSRFSNVFGEDADVVQLRSQDHDWTTDSSITFVGCELSIATRRIVKEFASHVYWYDTTFTNISRSHPRFGYALETGGFISLSNNAAEANDPAPVHVFDGCTFNGSDFDNRIINVYARDVSITNSVWNDVEFRLWQRGGALCVTDNTVDDGFRVYEVASPPVSYYGPVIVERNAGARANADETDDEAPLPPPVGDYVCPSVGR